jgi:hypothetical protein
LDSDSETSSSSSDSEKEEGSAGSKLKEKKAKKSDQEKSAAGQKKSFSSKLEAKLGGVLRRKSAKSPQQPSGEETATSHMPVPIEPRVLHGHTLTKGTTFREICHAIRDSAFVASDLPLVVSLEVHASLEQQQTMVDIMLEVWKGFLVEASPDEGKLPSLADLKRKILIKSKCVPFSGEEEKAEGEDLTPQKSDDKSGQQAPKPSKILDALAKLAVYTRAYKFSHFDQPGMHHHCRYGPEGNANLINRGQSSPPCVLTLRESSTRSPRQPARCLVRAQPNISDAYLPVRIPGQLVEP